VGWSKCGVCKVGFTGIFKLELAQLRYIRSNSDPEADMLAASRFLLSVLHENNEVDKAEKLCHKILCTLSHLYGETSITHLIQSANLTYIYYLQGRYVESLLQNRKNAATLSRSNFQNASNVNLAIQSNRCLLLDIAGQNRQAIHLQWQITSTYEYLHGPNANLTVTSAKRLVFFLTRGNLLAEAHTVCDALYKIQKNGSLYNIGRYYAAIDVATILFKSSKNRQALAILQNTYTDCTQKFGQMHPVTMLALQYQVYMLYKSGAHLVCISLCDTLLLRKTKLFGALHITTLRTAKLYAELLKGVDTSKCKRFTKSVLRIAKLNFKTTLRVHGECNYKTLEMMGFITDLMFFKHLDHEAIVLRKRQMHGCMQAYGDAHIKTLTVSRKYAAELQAFNRNVEASTVFETICVISRNMYGAAHQETLGAYIQLSTSIKKSSSPIDSR